MNQSDAIALARKLRERARAEGAPVVRIILYGSFAHGNPHAWSDIDLAVVTRPFRGSRAEERRLVWHIGQSLSSRVEALSFRPEDLENRYSPLAQEIRTSGIEVELS